MKYTFKKLPDLVVEAEVVLDHQEFLNYYQPVYDQVLSAVHLKGFRPGTAPKDLADKAVDKEKVFQEAVNKAARDALREITEENNWQLIDQPKVEVLDSEKGLKFKATLTVFPEVKLGNYQKIVKKVLAEKRKVLATDEEVGKTVKWVLESRAKAVGGSVPELTDEFAKTLGKFASAEEFKKSVRDGIQKEKEFKEDERVRLRIMEEIAKNSSIELPKIMVEKTLNSMVAEYRSLVKNPGEETEVRKNLEEKAKNNVAINLVLYQIAKEQKLEPTSEEVEKEANAFLSRPQFSRNPKIDTQRVYDYIYGEIRNRKVFEYLESLK